jgi:hypothetical protein
VVDIRGEAPDHLPSTVVESSAVIEPSTLMVSEPA